MAEPRHQVIFHAGFHKTGTTHVQRALETHRTALTDHVVATRPLSPEFLAAAEAARDYSIAPTAAAPEALAVLRQRLSDWAGALTLQPGQGLIASSEDFSGHMPGYRRLRAYSAAPAIARTIAEVRAARFGAALDLTFFYSTRQAESWIASVHWQLAKHPGLTMQREKFAVTYANAAELEAMVTKVRAAVPGHKVVSAPLEAHADRRLGLVEAIYDLAAVPDRVRKTLYVVPPQNQRPVHDLADAYVALNRAGIPRESLRRLKLALLASSELDRDLGV